MERMTSPYEGTITTDFRFIPSAIHDIGMTVRLVCDAAEELDTDLDAVDRMSAEEAIRASKLLGEALQKVLRAYGACTIQAIKALG